jgi:hypothetical protein
VCLQFYLRTVSHIFPLIFALELKASYYSCPNDDLGTILLFLCCNALPCSLILSRNIGNMLIASGHGAHPSNTGEVVVHDQNYDAALICY